MRLFPKDSLRRKFNFSLIGVASLILLFFSMALVSFDSLNIQSELENQLTKASKFAETTLPSALWQFDYDYIDEFVESVFLYDEFVFVNIFTGGERIISRYHPDFQGVTFEFFKESSQFITNETGIQYDGKVIGKIQLAISRNKIKKALVRYIVFIVGLTVLLILAISATTLFLTGRYIFSPLRKLEKSAREIAKGNLNAIIDKSSPDEIGHLAKIIDDMRGSIQNMFVQVSKTEELDLLNLELKKEIAEHRKTEAALKDSEHKLLAVLDATPFPVALADPDSLDIFYWSRSAFSLFGCTAASIPDWFGLVYPGQEQREKVFKHWKDDLHTAVMTEKTVSTGDYEINCANGISRVCEIHTTSLADAVLITFNDITDRKKAEQALRESETRLSLVVKGSNDAPWDWDLDKKEHYYSPQWWTMIGHDPKDFFKVPINSHDLMHPDDADVVNTFIQDRLQNGPDHYEVEFKLKHKKGHYVPILSRAFISRNEHGEPIRISGTNTDLTERKNVEAQIKANLREKETLLQEIHHRVKNNMQVISGLLRLQANSTEERQIKAALHEAQSRVYAMSALHEALYKSTNLSEISFESYISDIIESLIQAFRVDLNQIKFKSESDKVLLNMEIASPLGLVINELISNSLKHAFPNGRIGEILISMKKMNDNEVCLIISDNGLGIPDMARWEQPRSLGLKLVKNLVEIQLEGSIELDVSNGTQYTIRFAQDDNNTEPSVL